MSLRSLPHGHDRRPGEPMEWRSALRLFESLSHPGRLAVFRSLCRAGAEGLSLQELARDVRTTGSALTFHLRALESAGLVLARPSSLRGKSILFLANREPMLALIRLILSEGDLQDPP